MTDRTLCPGGLYCDITQGCPYGRMICAEAIAKITAATIPQIKWPRHEASLELTHNEHKSCYRTVAESVADDEPGYRDEDWVSAEQKQKAIAANECWSLHWYPDPPVGFCIVSAADLDVLLVAVRDK